MSMTFIVSKHTKSWKVIYVAPNVRYFSGYSYYVYLSFYFPGKAIFMSNSKVVVHLSGGLGNQLFQYMAGTGLA